MPNYEIVDYDNEHYFIETEADAEKMRELLSAYAEEYSSWDIDQFLDFSREKDEELVVQRLEVEEVFWIDDFWVS